MEEAKNDPAKSASEPAITSCSPAPFSCVADPVLHYINQGIGTYPLDMDRIDGARRAHVDHHPLRVQRIALAREVAGQIRIALPVTLKTSDQRCIATGHKVAMRQRIRVAVV